MTGQSEPQPAGADDEATEGDTASAAVPWMIIGAAGLALSAVVAWMSWAHYPLGTLDRPGPGLFPLAVAVLLALTSVLTLLESRVARYTKVPLVPRRLLLSFAVIAGGALSMPHVGFLPVAFFGGLVLAMLIERRFRWVMVPTMLGMAVAIFLLFEHGLGIRLPGLPLLGW